MNQSKAKMEHRLTCRREANQPAALFQRDRCIGHGHIQNASRLGALVESENASLISNGYVELEIARPGADPIRLRGLIIHRHETKFGVMLMDEWREVDQIAPLRALSCRHAAGSMITWTARRSARS